MENRIEKIYRKLFDFYGQQHWWPAQTKEEIIIGAILTQNTAWKNVEKAIQNLKATDSCNLNAIFYMDIERLKDAIKPAGFFNQKSIYLKNISRFFKEEGGIERLFSFSTEELRKKLLSVKGIGKETADSILLYAFERPIFVIDAYTKRLAERHKLSKKLDYDCLQKLFMDNLPKDYKLFNEYHALIVKNAKEFCRKKPDCENCPLRELL
ncbi:endonuclease III domain-containing protein [Hippea alviniae]|uniref:endonuclease III domain-containing protein n=1 Tax=Hippea alviniae TaxID=1279027 RepID=UPI0003B36CE4|nr:endonuclease III domain-containing protein [Hippea alviniae]